MPDITFERHRMSDFTLPFIFHSNVSLNNTSGLANWHDNTEFLYCTEGEGSVSIDASKLDMKAGDLIIVNARCLHLVKSESFFKYHCLIIDNSFFMDNGINIEDLYFTEKLCDHITRGLFLNIADCLADKSGKVSVARKRLSVLEFICHIHENHSRKKNIPSSNLTKSYRAVLDAIEYINKHYAENITLESISSFAGFSRYHFTRIFKQSTGITLVEYINARRCKAAAMLLRESRKSISEICIECGFDTPSYFAKSFKSFYGILPSAYRKKYGS